MIICIKLWRITLRIENYLKCKDKTYILECKDNQGEDCIYHVDLPNGTYVYYSRYDTTIFKVDSGKVKELRPFLKQKLTIYKWR